MRQIIMKSTDYQNLNEFCLVRGNSLNTDLIVSNTDNVEMYPGILREIVHYNKI